MPRKETYRRLCAAANDIPIFARDWWLDTVCGEKNWEVLLIEEKGVVKASMPIYLPLPGVVSMPAYTQAMGPWFAPEAPDCKYTTRLGERQRLCRRFIDELKRYPCFYQRFHYAVTDWLPFYWAGYRQTTRYTYRLPDLTDAERLYAAMSANIRRNITKAQQKYHITVRRGIPVADFLAIQQKTFERQGLSAQQDTQVLTRLIATCRRRGQGELWGGYDAAGRLHAAVFVVWQPDCAWYLAGGGDSLLRTSGAHSLVLWRCIRELAPVCRQFDFEGSMLPGVERFFREFGAVQTPYFSITRGKVGYLQRALIKLKRLIR